MVLSFVHSTVEVEKTNEVDKIYLFGDEAEDVRINQKTENGSRKTDKSKDRDRKAEFR